MVKGLLDAMQGPVYSNDRVVQHLSARRLVHDGDHSLAYYKTHIMHVEDARSAVMTRRRRPVGLGSRRLLLTFDESSPSLCTRTTISETRDHCGVEGAAPCRR